MPFRYEIQVVWSGVSDLYNDVFLAFGRPPKHLIGLCPSVDRQNRVFCRGSCMEQLNTASMLTRYCDAEEKFSFVREFIKIYERIASVVDNQD